MLQGSSVRSLAALALLCAAPMVAQDTCATATPIGDGNTIGNTLTATTGPDPVPPCGFMGNDVWFAYTASCTGTATASLCTGGGTATFDTVLAAWAGTCGCLVNLKCNDDFPSCAPRSQVSFSTTVGTVYYISLGGLFGETGAFVLNMSCTAGSPPPAPTNDTCAGAVVLSEGVTVAGTNVNATTEGFCPGSDPTTINCGFANGADGWYSLTPTCTGTYSVSTCDPATTLDTVITVWSGSCGSLAEITCNDFDPSGCPASPNASTATWSATAGTTYYISVAGVVGAQGAFNIVAGLGGGAYTLAFLTAGTGTIGYQVVGGPPNGLAYTAITGIAGAYPVDWFFGVAMTLNDIFFQLAFGFPFVAPLDACGSFALAPVCCLPSGLNVYGVSIAATSPTAVASAVSNPANAMIP